MLFQSRFSGYTIHLLVGCFLLINSAFSQHQEKYPERFQLLFGQAKTHLAHNDVERAFPLFRELYEMDSSHANICYLLGVCYTEEKSRPQRSLQLLKKAAKNISSDYDPGDHLEKQAPIFVYYYMVEAYRQLGECDQAGKAKEQFHHLYGREKYDFYVQDAIKRVEKCRKENDTLPAPSRVPEIDREPEIITKNVEYSLRMPLYGVQVGAYSRLVPIYEFENLKNVEAFIDKEGVIRYVIGHFPFRSQAEKLAELVHEAGYSDAFIVDVNKEKRYSEEVIIVNNSSFKAPLQGQIEFRVQVGAFREEVPVYLLEIYLMIGGIKENMQDDLTVLTAGAFDTFEEAESYKMELLEMGIPGAFVVAFHQGRKVPMKQAMHSLKSRSR